MEKQNYFLVAAHREENGENVNQLLRTAASVKASAAKYKIPILISTHPRTRARVEKAKIIFDPLIQLLKPFGFFDYNALQVNARVTLSDSGTISEESSILNFPELNSREDHERPKAMEETGVMMTGLNSERILQAIAVVENKKRGAVRELRCVAA